MSTSNKGNAPHMPQANLYRQILIYIHTSKVTVAYVNLTIKTRQYTNHFLLLLKIHFSYIIYHDYNFSFLYSSQFLPISLHIHIPFCLLTDNSHLKGNNIVLHCIVLYCTICHTCITCAILYMLYCMQYTYTIVIIPDILWYLYYTVYIILLIWSCLYCTVYSACTIMHVV